MRDEAAVRQVVARLKGQRVPQLLKSARRAGLLRPEILEALDISGHPLVLAVQRHASDYETNTESLA